MKRWLCVLAVLWVGVAYAGGMCLPGKMNYIPYVAPAVVTVTNPPGLQLELIYTNWSQNATLTYGGTDYPIGTWTDSLGSNDFLTQGASTSADGLRFKYLDGAIYSAAYTTNAIGLATFTDMTICVRGTLYASTRYSNQCIFSSRQSISPVGAYDADGWYLSYPTGTSTYGLDSWFPQNNPEFLTFAHSSGALTGEHVWVLRSAAASTTLDMFVDGTKYSATYTTADRFTVFTGGEWCIGAHRFGHSPVVWSDYNYTNFAIKNLRVYNRALTDEEIVGYAW